jgi:4-amino-4-deoxy-L-arabinose transferase-like glycosyltransferase
MSFCSEILSGRKAALFLILAVAVVFRLYRIDAPLVEGSVAAVKQVYIANKARSIAGPPLRLLNPTYDFLDQDGRRMAMIEEVPAYTGLVGTCYHLFGEREWIGRVWSILATLVAVLALCDLVRREFGSDLALPAAALFSLCPLLIFYGRAVQPDLCMLACMLLSACFYHRYVDGARLRWLLAAALAGLLGAAFKYYGLMVLIPLADLTVRRTGWRGLAHIQFLFLGGSLAVPVFAWVIGVFARHHNPADTDAYFLFQRPALVLQTVLYERFVDRFLWKDCGPITAVLIVTGVALARLHGKARPILGWTLMGVLFFFLLGPKVCCHGYYELMMLPAAAAWAALGWQTLWAAARQRFPAPARRQGLGVAALAILAAVHSPWVIHGERGLERGSLILAERLNRLCGPSSKVVALGANSAEVIHYSHRQGWVLPDGLPGRGWREELARYQSLGATYVAVYLSPHDPPGRQHASLPLLASFPVVEHQAGPWSSWGDHRCEFYILRLQDAARTRPSGPAGK